MQVYRLVILYLGFVVCLSLWLPSGLADKEDVPTEDAGADDEPEVEVDSEAEAPEEKVRTIFNYSLCYIVLVWQKGFLLWQEKPVKKPAEVDEYKPPVISLEHEDSVYFAEPFADPAVFKARWEFWQKSRTIFNPGN